MALNIHWPCNSSSIAPLFSSASLDCPRSSRGIMPTNLAALVSNTNTIRGSLKPIQFSALIQSLRGRASGDESFDVVETQGQEPGVSNAETQSNGPSTHSLLQDEIFLREVSLAKDAEAVLSMIAEKSQGSGGIVSKEDCATIIISALAQNNADLPFSILDAMRSNLIQRRLDRELQDAHIRDSSIMCWSWAQPDVMTYTTLVRGLAASLRVSDAIQIIKDISRVGVPPVDEVPFGKVVKCPNCMIALAVVQPQHGIQLVSCSRCRYQYELMSGEIVNIESESTR